MEIRRFPRNLDGLTVLQLRMIAVLNDVSDLSIQGLANILAISYDEAWENVRILSTGRGGKRRKRGWKLLEIFPSPSDRRSRCLILTTKGESLAKLLTTREC